MVSDGPSSRGFALSAQTLQVRLQAHLQVTRISGKKTSMTRRTVLREFTRTLLPASSSNARNVLLIGCLLVVCFFCLFFCLLMSVTCLLTVC